MNEPLVSVVVITYNHEKYIRQTLDSILMQKVDFSYEVLVGDDCSIDSTPEILKEYKIIYPEIFHIKLRRENVGSTRNSHDLFCRAKGSYIAVLEGDDFWTNEKKLQKQVDFLEKNKEYSGCCCRFHCVDDAGKQHDMVKEKKIKDGLYYDGKIYTIQQYKKGILPSQAGTMVFRNVFTGEVDTSILYKAHRIIGDFTVVLLVLLKGNIYIMPDNMAAYRKVIEGGDSWSAAGSEYSYYGIFQYHTFLEEYAKRTLGAEMSSLAIKKKMFFRFSLCYFQRPSRAKRNLLAKMFFMTGHKLEYAKVFLETMYLSKLPEALVSMDAVEWEESQEMAWAKKTWKDFLHETEDKKIVMYGAGGGCDACINEWYDVLEILGVVDNSEKRQGKYICGFRIYARDFLDDLSREDTAIIITPGSCVREIYEDIQKSGFRYIYSFCYMEARKPRCFIFRKALLERNYLKSI